jgi:hypothetical protein
VPNAFTVGLGGDGGFRAYAYSGVHLIVDVTGYYAPPGGGLYYHPLASPVRLLDTRPGQPACQAPGRPLGGGEVSTVSARIDCTGIPGSAQVVVGNATVVNPADGGAGYVTLWPGGGPQPNVSNLNYVPGQVVPNAFTAGLGGDGTLAIYAYTTLDFVLDVTGYYSAEPSDEHGVGLLYAPLASPFRLLDTRAGQVACYAPGVPLGARATRVQPARVACSGAVAPGGARAVVGNATVVNGAGGGAGYVTLYPSGADRPTVSNLNYAPGQIVPNAFTVGLGDGDGAFAIYAYTSTDFVVDVSGYFAP